MRNIILYILLLVGFSTSFADKYNPTIFIKDKKDPTKKIIVNPQYDKISFRFCGYDLIIKDTLGGLIKRTDLDECELVVPLIYSYMAPDEDFKYMKLRDTSHLISTFDMKKEQIINEYYPYYLKQILIKFSGILFEDGYCFVDNNGVSVSDKFDHVERCGNGKIFVEKDSCAGFLDSNFVYTEDSIFLNTSIDYKKNYNTHLIEKLNKDISTYGLVDSTFKVIIPFVYDTVIVCPNFAVVRKDDHWGVISTLTGKITTPLIYDKLEPLYNSDRNEGGYDENYLVAYKDGKYGLITINNKIKRPFVYDSISTISYDQILTAIKDGKYGIMSPKKEITPMKYDTIFRKLYKCGAGGETDVYFDCGYVSGMSWDGWSYLPCPYYVAKLGDSTFTLSTKGKNYKPGGIFEKDGKYGFNMSGKTVLPAKYSGIQGICYNMKKGNRIYPYLVSNNEKYGVWTSKGKWITPIKYDTIIPIFVRYSYDNDDYITILTRYFHVTKNDKEGIYNYKGKCIIPVKFDDIDYEEEEIDENTTYSWFEVENDDYVGVFNSKGKCIIPIEYYRVKFNNNKIPHFIVTDKYGLKGAYSPEGKLLLSVKYKNIRYDAENNKLVGEE